MSPDVITSWAWIVWLALILVFVIIEVTSLDFTFLMLAIGSLGGLLSGLLGAPWWAQIVIAGIVALVLLFLVRPRLLVAMRRGADPARSGVDALLGISGTVVKAFDDGRGQVKLANGETWTARIEEPLSLDPGVPVRVVRIDGATAFVRPDISVSEL